MNNTKYTKSARKFLRMVIKGEKKKKKGADCHVDSTLYTLALIRSIEPIRSKPLVNAMYFQGEDEWSSRVSRQR